MSDTSHPPTSGVLSNVFGFLSREVETFVATASGSLVPETRSSSRSRRSRSDGVHSKKLRRPKEPTDYEETNPASSARMLAPSDHLPPPLDLCQTPRKDTFLRARHYTYPTSAHPSSSSHDQLSVTMPGSLFPRSPSLVPDEARHVHFATQSPSPFLRRGQTSPPGGYPYSSPVHGNTPSDLRQASGSGNALFPDNFFTSPRKGVPSVKDAVRQFYQSPDRPDPTLMLPSPSTSPTRVRASQEPHQTVPIDAGSARPIPSIVVQEPSFVIHDDGTTVETEGPPSSPSKGKEKAIDLSFEVEVDSSGFVRMRGKEKELDDAREEHREKQQWRQANGITVNEDIEHNYDKARIKSLEKEVEQLKAELARRSMQPPSVQPELMPPPPPPPPPQLSPGTLSSYPIPPSKQDSLLAAARASLKHTATPIEAPINVPGVGAGGRTKRTGQPTVNISGDKMESFLNEVKSVKLRRVGDHPTPSTSRLPPLRRRATLDPEVVEQSQQSWFGHIGNTTLAGHEIALGKRKRDQSSGTSQGFKRHHETLSDVDVSSSTTANPSLPSHSGSRAVRVPQRVPIKPNDPLRMSVNGRPPVAGRPSSVARNYPIPPRLPSSSQSLPSASTVVTTPSLSSDNDGDPENETASDEHTPPIYLSDTTLSPPVVPSARDRKAPSPELFDKPRQHVSRATGLLDKRLSSTSAMLTTPRKPRPPGRRTGSLMHHTEAQPPSSDAESEEDPLLLNFSPYHKATTEVTDNTRHHRKPSPLPALDMAGSARPAKDRAATARRASSSAQPSRRSAGSSTSSRGLPSDTLSDELAEVFELSRRYQDITDDDFDSGVLVGVGTRSKNRGFLARGGAGGEPVFMGVGYVDGAEESEGEDVVLEPSVPIRRHR